MRWESNARAHSYLVLLALCRASTSQFTALSRNLDESIHAHVPYFTGLAQGNAGVLGRCDMCGVSSLLRSLAATTTANVLEMRRVARAPGQGLGYLVE